MDDSSEVQAYSSAAADAYLSKIDDSFVEHALRLAGAAPGCALDIGCGPGQILMKLSARLPEWKLFGIDRSLTMIGRARETLDSRVNALERAAKRHAVCRESRLSRWRCRLAAVPRWQL